MTAIERSDESGNRFYRIAGLFDVQGAVRVTRDDYRQPDIKVSINGTTRLDVDLVRR